MFERKQMGKNQWEGGLLRTETTKTDLLCLGVSEELGASQRLKVGKKGSLHREQERGEH